VVRESRLFIRSVYQIRHDTLRRFSVRNYISSHSRSLPSYAQKIPVYLCHIGSADKQ
jgi:hypothetical protein